MKTPKSPETDHRSPPPPAEGCLCRPYPSSQKGGTLIAEHVVDMATQERSASGKNPLAVLVDVHRPGCKTRTTEGVPMRTVNRIEPGVEPSGLDPLGLIVRDHRGRVRTPGTLDQDPERDHAFRRALESEDDELDSDRSISDKEH